MPLRARIINSLETTSIVKDVFGPALSRSEWAELRQQVRKEEVRLELPCCSTPALLRVSSLGLQHFYHKPQSDCHYANETVEHMRAILLIYNTCLAEGWIAKTDWFEDEWFANVLAEKVIPAGTGTMLKERIAFQVKWSSQTIAETLKKHDSLAAGGVQGVWLFHSPPPQVQNRNIIGIDGRRANLIGYRGLPLFYLKEKTGDRDNKRHINWDQLNFQVYLSGQPYPLDTMISAWLQEKIQHCEGWHQHSYRFCDKAHWFIAISSDINRIESN